MRLVITTLSMLCVIAFGYALAGYGSSLFGGGVRLDYIIGGLSAGVIFGGLAMFLWYRHRKDFFEYDGDDENLS
ncbi:MAG: hypothetical protein IJG65_07400 [Synergistaceae bacterium]|nr:hypothetical protein [Synergistaceae bacterium]